MRWRFRSLFDCAEEGTFHEIALEERIDQQDRERGHDNGRVFNGLPDLERIAATNAGRHAFDVAGDENLAQDQLERIQIATLDIDQRLEVRIPVRYGVEQYHHG